jgi:predicted secreted hydrolase
MAAALVAWILLAGAPGACGGDDDTGEPPDPYGVCPNPWRAYPYEPAGTDIRFPEDEGAHYLDDLSVTMEWWYTIYHLTTAEGREFSVMASFFMPQLDIAYRPFNITDVHTGQMFDSDEWGSLQARTGHLELDWTSEEEGDVPVSYFHTRTDGQGELVPFGYEQQLYHHDPQTGHTQSLHLVVDAVKSPYLVAGDGLITIGDSGDSYYYSLTHLEVSGELELGGEVFGVTGIGWLDHQWGPFMLSPLSISLNSYEWMALHLDNGDEYMVSTLFDVENRTHREEGFGSIGWKLHDCTQGITLDHTIERLAYWQQPESERYYSHRWRIVVPDTGLDVILEPVIEDQTVAFFHTSFYEGRSVITGTLNGEPIGGLAFVELVHHYEPPEVEILSPAPDATVSATQLLTVFWDVANPDDGLRLTYTVTADDGAVGQALCADPVESPCDIDLTGLSGPVTLQVGASSVDGVITGADSLSITVLP